LPQRILIVDDEPDILQGLRDALEQLLDLPVTVDTANTGEAAKELLEQPDRRYDMVISDEKMPGLRGIELLEWLRLMHPHAVRVLMTAYREGYIGQDAVNRAGAHLFLYKPFDLQEVLPQVRKALGDKRRRDEQQRSLERALRLFRKLSRETA
jgi:DNA-binding NtrC family response regulator